MRILFFASGTPDYVGDGLLHGLRSLLGADVVDVPKQVTLYRTCPPQLLARSHGRGFSLYGQLDDLQVDRAGALADLRARRFDAVVFGDIWRQDELFARLAPELPGLARSGVQVAVVDGADSPALYPYAGRWLRRPRGWLLPRAHRRFPYFKREWTPDTLRYRAFGLLPRSLCRGREGWLRLRPIAISIPAERVVGALPTKTRRFPSHIVDQELADRLGDGSTHHVFDREEDYQADLRASTYGITTRRAGWDCLRHYEIAAAGAVPCFRDLDEKPPLGAPHGLHAGNSISYRSADDLLRRLDGLDADELERLQRGALAWVRGQTTIARARAFLGALAGPT